MERIDFLLTTDCDGCEIDDYYDEKSNQSVPKRYLMVRLLQIVPTLRG